MREKENMKEGGIKIDEENLEKKQRKNESQRE